MQIVFGTVCILHNRRRQRCRLFLGQYAKQKEAHMQIVFGTVCKTEGGTPVQYFCNTYFPSKGYVCKITKSYTNSVCFI